MTLYNLEAIKPAPRPSETLAALADALSDKVVRPSRRACATQDSRHPEEGLALLKAYVAIDDSRIRQAILDLVLGIAQGDHQT